MRSLHHSTAIAFASLLCFAGVASTAVAQDATPAGGECVATTPEENVAIVESFIAATEAQDAEAIDAMLADDLVYELDRYGLEVDHTTNEDEVAMIVMQEQVYPGSTTTIEDTIAQDDKVVVHQVLSIDSHLLTGEPIELEETLEVDQMIIYTIECGVIVGIDGVIDEIHLLTGLGLIEPLMGGDEATPAP